MSGALWLVARRNYIRCTATNKPADRFRSVAFRKIADAGGRAGSAGWPDRVHHAIGRPSNAMNAPLRSRPLVAMIERSPSALRGVGTVASGPPMSVVTQPG